MEKQVYSTNQESVCTLLNQLSGCIIQDLLLHFYDKQAILSACQPITVDLLVPEQMASDFFSSDTGSLLQQITQRWMKEHHITRHTVRTIRLCMNFLPEDDSGKFLKPLRQWACELRISVFFNLRHPLSCSRKEFWPSPLR